jgi:hypothetical protein
VLGAQDTLLAGEHLLIQPDGQPHLAGVLIDGGQVAPERQGDLILVTERPLGVGHRLLQQRNGPLRLTCRTVGRGQIVPHGRGDQIVGTQRPLAIGQRLLQQGDGLTHITRCLIGRRQLDLGHYELGVLVVSHCACPACHGGDPVRSAQSGA